MENNQNQIDEEKKKKKRILLIIFAIAFLVPIGFGIYNLIPERPAPIPSYNVKLTNNYNNALTLSNNTAYDGYIYKTKINLNKQIVDDKVLPSNLNKSDVQCEGKPVTFTYSVSSNYVAELVIPKENVKGKISINVTLVIPTQTYDITLKANGGKFEDGDLEKTFNVYYGQKLSDLAGYTSPSDFREGYHFDHWELESNREVKFSEQDNIPFTPEGATYLANCELNDINVNFNPGVGGKFPGMALEEVLKLTTLYDTTINKIDGYLGEPTKDNYKFLYYVDVNNKHYLPTDTVTIPDEWDENFGLKAIYSEDLFITLDPNGGTLPEGSTYFDTYKGITLGELKNYVTPTPSIAGTQFTHWSIESDEIKYYEDTPIDKAGSITLVANYSPCQHEGEFVEFAVVENRLYGICPDCGARVLIPDEDLSKYEGQFLMIENEADSSANEYALHDIVDMENIIVTAEDHAELDMYFIYGEYDLVGSRGAGQKVITVNAHGLLNSEGELTATVDCTHIQPEPYPRFYLYVNFTFDNMIMKGEQGPSDFYTGIYAATVKYSKCKFIGMQSLYSDAVVFEDCYFDAIIGRTSDPEYSIYSYNSFNVEFKRCTFYSEGKALKIYSEGAGKNATFVIEDCNFTLNDTPRKTDKAPIEIDSTYQTSSPYNVFITRCTYDDRYENGLYHDTSTHSNIHVTEI